MCGKGYRIRLKAISAQSSQPVADEPIKVSQHQPGKAAF